MLLSGIIISNYFLAARQTSLSHVDYDNFLIGWTKYKSKLRSRCGALIREKNINEE